MSQLSDFGRFEEGLKWNLRLTVITTAKYFVPRVLLGQFRHRCIQALSFFTSYEPAWVLERLSKILMISFWDNSQKVLIIYDRFRKCFGCDRTIAIPNSWKKYPPYNLAEEPFIMHEAGSGTRMAEVERFFANRVEINVGEWKLGSNGAIKRNCRRRCRYCHAMFWHLKVQKDHPYSWCWRSSHPASLVYRLSASKQLSVVAQTFWNIF